MDSELSTHILFMICGHRSTTPSPNLHGYTLVEEKQGAEKCFYHHHHKMVTVEVVRLGLWTAVV